jgi:hypothetical protein
LTYANVTFARVQCDEKNQDFFDWKNYLPPGLEYLNVFREKKPKDHYSKHYDLQLHALQFQNLQTSTALIEKENMFSVAGVLLYDAIPCNDLKDLCKEAAWLDLNANECKRGPNMNSSKMSMFGWRKSVYQKKEFAYGRYVSSHFCIDLFSIKF